MAESYTDVVVVGAGPAGLMASLYLSELGVKHRVVDKLGTRALNGRADGVALRTVEIWDSFDLATKLESYGNHFSEWGLWTAGEDGIARKSRQSLMNEDKSRKSLWTIHQGFLEAGLIEGAKKRGGPVIDRGAIPISLVIDAEDTHITSPSAHPLHLKIQYLHENELLSWGAGAHTKLDDGSLKAEEGSIAAFGNDPENTKFSGIQAAKQGTTETIHTKYIIGADGAHSWVRRQLGFEMTGANSDTVWAVLDIIAITDFPDIRKFCTVLSAHGGMLNIPREGKLNRFYIQLPEGESRITLDNPNSPIEIFKQAKKILHPYSLDYTYSDWWTVYKVGHRLSSGFSHNNRIFLAGDAVHTHTPKAGQGSNVSQQDGYNLAWKIAGTLHGQLKPSVLSTYEEERQPIAAELIGLDMELSGVLGNRTGVVMKKVDSAYDRLKKFGSHISIEYDANSLIAPRPEHNGLSTDLLHGTRIRNAYVYNHASANLTATHRILLSTGSWNLFVLAGNIKAESQISRLNELAVHLQTLVHRYPHISARQQPNASFLRIRLFAANKLSDFTAKDVHPVYFPRDPKLGYDYDTLFGDLQADGADMRKPEHSRELDGIHKVHGVDAERGGLILLRPDQVISWTGHLEDGKELEAFFEGCMQRRATNGA